MIPDIEMHFIFVVGTTIFLFLSAIGSYEAFHYTESNKFCGTLCHKVMIPEHTAYQESPHARVGCVDCHVGTGAGWYMRSKLSGLCQVYATSVDNFPAPNTNPNTRFTSCTRYLRKMSLAGKILSQTLSYTRHYIADEANT